VSKPYVVEEVDARLAAMLRRPVLGTSTRADSGAQPGLVVDATDGPLVLDADAGQLLRGGDEVHLTRTEFRLLVALAEHRGQVLSREQLLEQVWDRGFFGDERIVDVHVRRLRQKIEENASRPDLLVTVRGLGYRLDTR
jgi:DNA-binding response OmpR family regulator